MSDRDAFERAVKSKWSDSYSFARNRNGDYLDSVLSGMWFGWQASRKALSSCPEIPDSSATGNAVAMGDLTDNDDEEYERSLLIQFASVEDFHAARSFGQCRFTVFGGGV